jgi:alpha,alpha-trehalase
MYGRSTYMSKAPRADCALHSDRHSAALVSRDGSIGWLCLPPFDSPSIFGRLLGDEAGHWSIRATVTVQVTRRFLDRTMVLKTTFRTPAGTVSVIDALVMDEGNRGHVLGKDAPNPLLRRATRIEGEVEFYLEVRPAPGIRALLSSTRCRRWRTRHSRWPRRSGPLLQGP